jgi:hypothetical protein
MQSARIKISSGENCRRERFMDTTLVFALNTVDLAAFDCDFAAFSLSAHALHCCGCKYLALQNIYATSLQCKNASPTAIKHSAVVYKNFGIEPLSDDTLQLQRVTERRMFNINATYKN